MSGSWLLAFAASLLVPCGQGNDRKRPAPRVDVVYVDGRNEGGPWDGRSWASAFRTVQEGIDAADKAGGGEVWVAAGIYTPTSLADPSVSTELRAGVAVYGGFEGTETTRDQRDWRGNRTILSGDIGTPGERGDNALHVVVGANEAVLDGFTVTGGHAQQGGVRPGGGGGERPAGAPPGGNQHLTPELIASAAGAGGCGGGMYNFGCSPTVAHCTFVENAAGKGGGMYNANGASPVLVDCVFERNGIVGNSRNGRGGGMANDLGSAPALINCTFTGNSTGGKGGGIYNDFNCSPIVTNCVFIGNSALRGGAVANDGGSSPIMTNCTFTRNYAADLGGAVYNGTYRVGGVPCSPVLTNCILWGNITPSGPREISNWHEDAPQATYCDVEGGYAGEGNIDADPVFADAESGDVRLQAASPCIDAGNGMLTWGDVPLAAQPGTREVAVSPGGPVAMAATPEGLIVLQGSRLYKLDPSSLELLGSRWLGGTPGEGALGRPANDQPLAPQADRAGNRRCDAAAAPNGRSAGTPPVDMGAYEWQEG